MLGGGGGEHICVYIYIYTHKRGMERDKEGEPKLCGLAELVSDYGSGLGAVCTI